MNKSVVKYRRHLPAKSGFGGQELLILVLLAGVIIWVLTKQRTPTPIGQYSNKEEWSVSYNSDGLPTRIVIHRDAKRA